MNYISTIHHPGGIKCRLFIRRRSSAWFRLLAAAAFSFFFNLLQAQNSSGLLGHYTFCDCTAKDNSGNNNDGTIIGRPACITGSRDYGLLFNQRPGGNNGCGRAGGEYIRLPATGAVWSEGFTVCAWVRYDQISYFERIIDFSNGTGETGGMPIWFGREGNSNNLTLESWISSSGSQARATGRLVAANVITNGAIEYYCATIGGDTMSIYVNGNLVAQRKGNPIANVPRTNNFIGHSAWCANDPDFKGFMDEVRIYNRALGPEEIRSLFKVTNITDFAFTPVCYTNDAAFAVSRESQVDSVTWNFGDAASGAGNQATGFNVTHRFSDTGNFTVRAIAYKYCVNDTVIKTVHIGPYQGFLGPDFSICYQPRTVQPMITASAYLWEDGFTSGGRLISQPGLYWLKATVNGCDYADTLLVKDSKASSEIYQAICAGKQHAGYSVAGSYIDTFKTANGCDSIRTLRLSVLPPSTNTIVATTCAGTAYLGYTASGTYRDTFPAVNGCDSIRTLQLTVLPVFNTSLAATICDGETYMGHSTAGTHIDTLRAANGCDSIRSVTLAVLKRPVPVLPPDTAVCGGSQFTLSPGSFDTYQWQDGSMAANYTVTQTGLYNVTVGNGCGTATVSIMVNMDSCRFVFPSAFTPDGNGKNDEFRLLSANGVLRYILVVYDRWGQKVFETRDYKKGWNGLVRNTAAGAGVYVWQAHIETANGNLSRKGTVVLIR